MGDVDRTKLAVGALADRTRLSRHKSLHTQTAPRCACFELLPVPPEKMAIFFSRFLILWVTPVCARPTFTSGGRGYGTRSAGARIGSIGPMALLGPDRLDGGERITPSQSSSSPATSVTGADWPHAVAWAGLPAGNCATPPFPAGFSGISIPRLSRRPSPGPISSMTIFSFLALRGAGPTIIHMCKTRPTFEVGRFNQCAGSEWARVGRETLVRWKRRTRNSYLRQTTSDVCTGMDIHAQCSDNNLPRTNTESLPITHSSCVRAKNGQQQHGARFHAIDI